MEKKGVSLVYILFMAYFFGFARAGKLCDFQERFKDVRTSCRNPYNDASSTHKYKTTSAGNTEGTTNGDDCFEVIGITRFRITNGSSTLNADCTMRIACNNGEINVLGEHNCSTKAVCEIRNDVRNCYCVIGYYGDGEICTNKTNCLDIFNDGYHSSGIYTINPSNWNGSPFEVYCNMTDGGGWTVFQRRGDRSVDFNRSWISYKDGFGDLDHEFWLGNDKLFHLTNDFSCKLRIEVVSLFGFSFYVEFESFLINNRSDNYRLSELGEWSGATGFDALVSSLNAPFTTFDRDNDNHSTTNCAQLYGGAWWFGRCDVSNPNSGSPHYILLKNSGASYVKYQYSEMKIRPNM